MEKKKSGNVLLVIMGVLIIVAIVARIATFQFATVSAIPRMIVLLYVALYGFWFYKKPHGNLLKYAMLIFAAATIIGACYFMLTYGMKNHIIQILASAALCYCAGRLNRIDQNKYLLPIIGLAYLSVSVYLAYKTIQVIPDNIFRIITCFNSTIIYTTLMIAYFVRFKEHMEAGLKDRFDAK